MDDADLAGPLLFGFCFGMFLLLVSYLTAVLTQLGKASYSFARTCCVVTAVRQASVRIYIRCRITGRPFHLLPPQPHVTCWHRRLSSLFSTRLLLTTARHHISSEYRLKSRQHHRLRPFDNKYHLVRILSKWHLCQRTTDAESTLSRRVSCHAILRQLRATNGFPAQR
jgi:hypothetical protein